MAKMIDLHFGFRFIPLIQLDVSIRKYILKSSWLSFDLNPKYFHCILPMLFQYFQRGLYSVTVVSKCLFPLRLGAQRHCGQVD